MASMKSRSRGPVQQLEQRQSGELTGQLAGIQWRLGLALWRLLGCRQLEQAVGQGAKARVFGVGVLVGLL
jgi:hypothetical protein